jgi:heme oxygenase (biliverdin-IX-beta and delta-forming)
MQAEPDTNKGEIFLDRLRQATGPQHKKLESHPLSRSLMADVSWNEYGMYLLAMKGVMKEYDNKVLPLLKDVLPGYESRKKSGAIGNDIAFLEGKTDTIHEAEDFALPLLTSKAFAFGFAYVLEGASLGGRVIIKHVQSHLPVNEEKGASFFAGYGSQTGLYWKQLLEALVAFTIQNNCETEVIAGAQTCFSSIYTHFDKCRIADEV